MGEGGGVRDGIGHGALGLGEHMATTIIIIRQRGDLNPCGQSPMDFESITLTTRSHCPMAGLCCAPQTQITDSPSGMPALISQPQHMYVLIAAGMADGGGGLFLDYNTQM